MKHLARVLIYLFIILGVLQILKFSIQLYHKTKAVDLLKKAFQTGEFKNIPYLLKDNRAPWTPVLLTLLNSSDDRVRINALSFIPFAKDRIGAQEKLIELLRDSNWRVRFFAVKALGSIENNRTLVALGEAFAKEDMWQVQREIAIVVSKISDKKSIPIFLKTYESKNNKTKIFSAIVLYELTEGEEYLSFIKEVIYSDNLENVQLMIWTLSELKEKSVLPLLHDALNTTNDPKLIRTIGLAIKKMGEEEPLDRIR